MGWLHDLPIKRKLTVVILIICSTVLLIASATLATYEYFGYRRAMAHDMLVLADILGKNTRAALAFQDEKAANEILLALQSEPHVMSASLYDSDGVEFAKYIRSGTLVSLPEKPGIDGHQFERNYLKLFRPVLLNNKRIGTIHIQFDLEGLYSRLALFGVVAGLILLGSVLITLTLTSRLQRPISNPILALAETAKNIAERNDFSVRAANEGKNEVGMLTVAFNQMLDGIEAREKALQAANDALRAENVERKRAEVALDASQERTRAIVEVALDGIITMNHDGQIIDFNPAAERIFGFRAADIIGKELAETIIPPDFREQHRRGLARFLATGEAQILGKTLELVGLRADGTMVAIELSISKMPGTGPAMFTGFLRDITERKTTESRVQVQLAQLELLNRITRGIGDRQDLKSIFQVVNQNLEENLPVDFCCVCLYDQPTHEFGFNSVGHHSELIAHEADIFEGDLIDIEESGLTRCLHGRLVYEPDILQVQIPLMQRLAQAGIRSFAAAPLVVESQVFGVIVAGRKKENSFSSSECEFLRQLSGHVALASHQAQLHTALQKAYDDLRQTQQAVMQQERLRALGQMASGIAHDINNAISPIVLYTESLLENENLSERARDYLVTIQRAVDDVAQTVSRMREFYRHREPQLMLAPVQVNQLVDQVVDLTRARWFDIPQLRGVVIDLRKELAPDLPAIMGVESEIREALTNLVFNAVDSMPNGGSLILRTRATKERLTSDPMETHTEAHLEVIDSGLGMDEETRRRCLEPFYTTKGERGTGLGLAMVYGIIQRHSAGIEIESELGKGTTIRLRFGALAAPTAAKKDEVSHLVPSRLRLLIIDDDPMLLKSLRDTLETDGHLVTVANGGQGGIDIFLESQKNGEKFSAVFTDLGMPYVDGRKVASTIKGVSRTTPVILLTGWGQRLIAEGDIPADVDRVLSKPPRMRDLREALNELCKK